MNRSKKNIFHNFSLLTTGKLLGDAFTFLFFVMLSREYGQEGLGQYSLAMALSGFFVFISDFGLYNLVIKTISSKKKGLQKTINETMSVRWVLSLISICVLFTAITFLDLLYEEKVVIILIGIYQVIFIFTEGMSAIFIAHEDMYVPGLVEFTLKSIASLAAILVMYMGGDLVSVIMCFPIIALIQFVIVSRILKNNFGKSVFGLSLNRFYEILKEAAPFGLTSFLQYLSTRIDVVLLGFMLGAASAGIYNAAYRIIFLLVFISHFAGLALYPVASRLYAEDRNNLNALYRQSISLVILIGLPVAAGLWLTAPDLLILLYGIEFSESIIILQILSVYLLIAFIKNILGMFLMATDMQTNWTKFWAITAALNVIGNSLLIPLIGIKGAAISTLLSEAVLMLLSLVNLSEILGWPNILNKLFISTIAALGFCVPFYFYISMPIWVVIPISILIYVSILFSFKDIRDNEVKLLISQFKA